MGLNRVLVATCSIFLCFSRFLSRSRSRLRSQYLSVHQLLCACRLVERERERDKTDKEMNKDRERDCESLTNIRTIVQHSTKRWRSIG